jgi:hypothetical protein
MFYCPGDASMTRTALISDFSKFHLGGRAPPADLCRLLEMQWSAGGASDPSRIRFLAADQAPAQVAEESSGRADLTGLERAARAQAMTDMFRYSGFVAECGDGAALGYWFGPTNFKIDSAPIIRFDRKGDFSVLPGSCVAEALLALAADKDERCFVELRDQLERHGLHIVPISLAAIRAPVCTPTPQTVYQQILATYRANLSAAVPPQSGGPVEILATER